jgi:UDP-hydrolysing UDP-N-acetyl-D-glucosamine 2-epimerase
MTRKICIITGTRAEFGLLRTMMRHLQASSDVTLQVLVTGAHLTRIHGDTIAEIRADGFTVDAEVDMLLASDSRRAVGQSLGLAVMGLTNALDRLAPDIVVLLGDRYEVLAAAQAAMLLGIPIAHIHGGERTEGAIDDMIRHAVTKMSHLHFTATEEFRRRVIQLGEAPERVFNCGATGLDNIAELDPVSREELESAVGIKLDAPILLVTYHPVTLNTLEDADFDVFLDVLAERNGMRIVFTGANADALGQKINAKIENFCEARPTTCARVTSLGFRRYLSLMRISAAVVGNSSSGIVEAPFIGVPTVNVGTRQYGRPRAPSVIDCGLTHNEIRVALDKALSKDLQSLARKCISPYGTPGAGSRIATHLRRVSLDGILRKRFFDIERQSDD